MPKQQQFSFLNDPSVLGTDPSWSRKTWLERLVALNGYPVRPTYVPTSLHWAVIEDNLNLRLPPSFIELHNTFGSGAWGDIELFSAHPDAGHQFDPHRCEQILYNLWEGHGFDLYPTKGGLLPFADTPDRIILCWDTRNQVSQEWPIVKLDLERDRAARRNWSIPQMIYNLLKHHYAHWPHVTYFRSNGKDHEATQSPNQAAHDER